ncbi:NAD-dependent epimerase/dehydratase family protein [Flavihumibacter sp. CACIAM 22H1]|uniref:NAD-dependent epimerase/dehydratase family protein n=1 Tax=Flavihumibacter sp. CACIAM 22H1 TaxID=1812911 RepID=UPI0007A8FBCF|nr:NAD-dependent epimerase/dehydratase family protein [Flavihumibacter sp. CACIAM 22H1]KYP15127.1 MAG: Vi polysaccharide biosynthesis protein VipB/TviC [Flavihumibacter sp. CACIAM 22H1]
MNILVTGGAGFIGSHIVEALLKIDEVEKINILDNLSTGYLKNIEPFLHDPRVKFYQEDIRDLEACVKAAEGMDAVCHQAALGSVPRSIKDPITTHNVNVNGFVNILEACRKNMVSRIVYASSSSVYGDLPDSPKVEAKTGQILSPYAATKLTNEIYARAYAITYGMQIAGFRYFNVFGARQDPNGAYAAVIPLFFKAAFRNESPSINGDGSITRDFTYINNVVKANLAGMFKLSIPGRHEVFNIACGETTSLNKLWELIAGITGTSAKPVYKPVRQGDILQSLADINKASTFLEYSDLIKIEQGLSYTADWYKNESIKLITT